MSVAALKPNPQTTVKHFLELSDFTRAELEDMLAKAADYKRNPKKYTEVMKGEVLAEIFDKRSVRTFGSFDAGFQRMGGGTTFFPYEGLQVSKKESLEHIAGSLSGYFTAIVIRVSDADVLHALAENGRTCVINGMTDDSHPVQLMADVLTMQEHFGKPDGKIVVFAGDCNNNYAKTWMEAAEIFNFHLRLSGPKYISNKVDLVNKNVTIEPDLKKAARGADVIVTDVWTSMGKKKRSEKPLMPYQITAEIMKLAKPNALFMHCMPITPKMVRGKPTYIKEVTAEVLNSSNSVIIQQSDNRMYAQNGIMLHCLR